MNLIDQDFLLVLEALAAGVTPTEQATQELISLGLIEQADGVFVMTPLAHLRLEHLRTLVKAEDIASLSIAALPADVQSASLGATG